MKATLMLLSLPIVAALSFAPYQPAPQDPQAAVTSDQSTDIVSVISLAELRYRDKQGNRITVPARNVVEIRMFGTQSESVLLELLYENGDYSLAHAQAMSLIRSGPSTRDVKLILSKGGQMRFPRLP